MCLCSHLPECVGGNLRYQLHYTVTGMVDPISNLQSVRIHFSSQVSIHAGRKRTLTAPLLREPNLDQRQRLVIRGWSADALCWVQLPQILRQREILFGRARELARERVRRYESLRRIESDRRSLRRSRAEASADRSDRDPDKIPAPPELLADPKSALRRVDGDCTVRNVDSRFDRAGRGGKARSSGEISPRRLEVPEGECALAQSGVRVSVLRMLLS